MVKFKNFINKKSTIYFLIFLLSFLPLFKFRNEQGVYAGTTGDFVSVPNIKDFISERFTTLNISVDGGDGGAYHLPLYIPYYLIIYLFNIIGLGASFSDRVFLMLMMFFNLLSVFSFLSYLTRKISEKELFIKDSDGSEHGLLLLMLSVIFCYAPFFSNFIKAGHFLIFPMFGVFALSLKFSMDMLSNIDDKRKTRYIRACLILLFIFMPLPFSNVGNIISFFLCFGVYVFLYSVVFKINHLNTVRVFFTVIACFLIGNLWWLVPTYMTVGDIGYHEEVSRNTIGGFINAATEHSNPVNILLGQSEGPLKLDKLFTDSFLSNLVYICYIALFFISTLIFIKGDKKSKISLVIIFSILTISILVKGPQGPFPEVFNYLYKNVGIMQVFRRPSSKVYFFILLMLSALYTCEFYKAVSFSKRALKLLIYIVVFTTSSCFYYIFIARLDYINDFKIPEEMYSIRDFVGQRPDKKILLLPDLEGIPIQYDFSLNDVSGFDFQYYFFHNPIILPNRKLESLRDFNKKLGIIIKSKDYDKSCSLLKEFNIGYIVVRKNISNKHFGYSLHETNGNLYNNPFLQRNEVFGDYADVYTVSDDCAGPDLVFDNTGFKKYGTSLFISNSIHTSPNSLDVILRFKNNTNWKAFYFFEDPDGCRLKYRFVKLLKNDRGSDTVNMWYMPEITQNKPYRILVLFFPDVVLYTLCVLTVVFLLFYYLNFIRRLR